MIEIYDRSGKLLLTLDRDSLAGANLTEADLYGANLYGADLTEADLTGANLTGANLTGANLSGANLSGTNLSGANLSGTNLSGTNLSGANLSGAILPGFPDNPLPQSLAEAALATRDWLANERWVQGDWIQTPTGAYAGDCLACLHGAARYVGGPVYGPLLSDSLVERDYDVHWNDATGRTLPEVLDALTAVAEAAQAAEVAK